MTKYIAPERIFAVLIGIGIALSPIHNRALTDLVTDNGEVGFFLPAFGTALWLIGSMSFVVYNWGKLDWGNNKVFGALVLIMFFTGLSGINGETWIDKLAPLFMGVSLLFLYLTARKLGSGIFVPLSIGAAIASFGVIIYGLLHPGIPTGGYVFEGNYDIVVGYVLLGAVFVIPKYKSTMASLALLAMCMTGSPEAVAAMGVIGVAILIRRDWGKQLYLILGCLTLFAVLYIGLGSGRQLYSYVFDVITLKPTMDARELGGEWSESAIGYRIWIIGEAMSDIKVEGYNVSQFREGIVHNVPLVIVQQLGWSGILAGIAWLWVSIYCLVKTKWKYAWLIVLTLSIFDHYMWTQLGPVWWALIGVSSVATENDLIFKKA